MKALIVAALLCTPSLVAARTVHPHGPAAGAPGAPDRQELTSNLVAVAELYVRLGKIDQALTIYDELRAADPNDAELLEETALTCLRAPRCTARRLRLLEDAIARMPDRADLRAELVDTLVVAGDRPAALARARDGAARHPQDLRLRLAVVDLLFDDVKVPDLDGEVARLQRDFPRDGEAWLARAQLALHRDGLRSAARALRRGAAMCGWSAECRARAIELERDVVRVRREEHVNFRNEVGWADAFDDLQAARSREE